MKRRTLFLAVALGLGLFTSQADAATQTAFDQKSFEAAQAANKPILVAVHADWCPACTKQKPIMASLAAAPEYKDLVILVVDFDTQKDALKALNVQKQSTIIALRGKAEKDRAVGVTDEASIKALFQKTAG
jgi:thiol-disulfide isomerase/thioredoxin